MASTVTRSQSNRASMACGGTGDSHHGWAADMLSCQYGPKSLRNVSNTLLNLCHKELRQFWRKNGVQPGTSKVHLITWPVSVYLYSISQRHGILFHSSIMTSRSCWMLDTWCFSTFRLRMPHMCSIGFRSEDILDPSLTFTFISKAVVILAVCLGWLLCWKTVSEGKASSSASECHHTCWNPCFPQWTTATQYQQGVATHARHHLSQTSLP